ncbi:hypothetical protein GCM10027421_11760 [Microbacterium shaanxiense]
MDATGVPGRHDSVDRRGRAWSTIWPAALGVLVAAATAYALTDGRDIAPVVVASGVVYLAAAATGRRWTAWAAFGVTIPLIALTKVTDLDATLWLLVLAGILLVIGLGSRRLHPWWSFPLQTAAMLVLGAIAVIATQVNPVVGGLLVAAALLGHAAWDVYHHRTGRVVGRSLAEFCAVLDVLVAIVVAFVALAP